MLGNPDSMSLWCVPFAPRRRVTGKGGGSSESSDQSIEVLGDFLFVNAFELVLILTLRYANGCSTSSRDW